MYLGGGLRSRVGFVWHHVFEELVHGFLEADNFLYIVGIRHGQMVDRTSCRCELVLS